MKLFTEMHCGECGIEFGVPDHFYKERKENGTGWCCPNGHNRVFRESDVTKLERERNILKQQNARLADEAAAAISAREKSERESKRLKKRISAGTCPCCNRTFSNMAAHMKTQHPELLGANVVQIKKKSAK